MKCPKCGSKLKVIETRKNIYVNEIYRERMCNSCKKRIYSIEKIVDYYSDVDFQKKWTFTNRSIKRKKGDTDD